MASLGLNDQRLSQVAQLAKLPAVKAVATALVALGLFRRLSSVLTRRKVNNYLADKTWNWKKEIVVVTGGSSGIGAELVTKLAKRGVKVIIVDRNEPRGKLAPNTFFYQADISDPAVIVSIADRIRSEHGDPTVLVNNAGIGNAMPLLEQSEAQTRKVFDVNLIAPILLTQQFLPSMVKRNHGHIVNLASQASFVTQASNVEYACTKAGLLAFHEGLGQELRHVYRAPLVRTSSVHPTWVRTPLISTLIESGKLKDTTISADDVATAIVNQLYSGYGGRIACPESLGWTSLIRGLPGWLQESLRDKGTIVFLKALDKY